MSVELWHGPNKVNVIRSTFPGGESFIRIDDFLYNVETLQITLLFQNNGDLIDLMMMLDACKRRWKDVKYELIMPYLPYARQDRVMNVGESLSVKVVCDFINSLGFSKVTVKDIHSDVGVALLDNLCHINMIQCAFDIPFMNRKNAILVSPDAGANKKVLAFAKEYGYLTVVRADKTRDVSTGKITGTVVYSENVGNKDFLILDDLVDGGRTFIELAKELRKLTTGKIMLYVTHGIFSAGLEVFEGHIDQIYVSNLMNQSVKDSPLIRVI